MDIITSHINEIMPYYIICEIFYYSTKKYFKDFNHSYFLMHFIVNLINTTLLLPLINHMIYDPLGKYIINDDYTNLDIIYPMIIGLHTFHLIHHLNKINYDEIIHHFVTQLFWYLIHIADNPIYLSGIISMSGIPGGITYLLLFLQKYNIVDKITEKKISMYLNLWIRAPLCIVYSTIVYIIGLNNGLYFGSLFMAIFSTINGIHFMHNIIASYYLSNIKEN
jgi:hypothetical protein